MSLAVRVRVVGPPEVLQLERIELAPPDVGAVRVRHTVIGVNYIDVYHRSGLLPLALPSGIGSEAVGVVEAIGAGNVGVRVGDRVGYCVGEIGTYSEVSNVSAHRLIPLPRDIPDHVAAALMLKGLTVQYLFRQTYPLKSGDTILFHAAAGGVGLIACQWARALGVKLIGTVSSEDKAAAASAMGASHLIVYTRENFVERTLTLTGGMGVPVVYDSIGKDSFPQSLDCLAPRGLFVSFGNASGSITAFDTRLLAQKGSLYITRPTLATYAAKRADMLAMADELFAMVRAGAIKEEIGQEYRLADAANAHRSLEARKTKGATLLIP